jgi:signal peptidase I
MATAAIGEPASALDRRVRNEARALVRETRSGLKRHRERVSDGIAHELIQRAGALEEALTRGDRERMRAEMVGLDLLVDEHLSFARKSTLREYFESIAIAVMIALFLRAFVIEAFKIPSGSMIPTMEIGDHIFVNKFLYGVRIPYTTKKFFTWRQPKRGEVVVFIYPCDPSKDFIKRIVGLPGDTVEVRCSRLYVNGKLVPDKVASQTCQYNNLEEASGTWSAQTDCSFYEQTLDGHTFQTIHERDRPERDLDRSRPGNQGDHGDFPQRPVRSGVLDDRRCPSNTSAPDPRTPEERKAAMGRIEKSAPDPAYDGACGPQWHYVVPAGHIFVMGDNRANSSDSRVWGTAPIENIKGKALFIWWSSQPDDIPFAEPTESAKPAKGGVLWNRIGDIVE